MNSDALPGADHSFWTPDEFIQCIANRNLDKLNDWAVKHGKEFFESVYLLNTSHAAGRNELTDITSKYATLQENYAAVASDFTDTKELMTLKDAEIASLQTEISRLQIAQRAFQPAALERRTPAHADPEKYDGEPKHDLDYFFHQMSEKMLMNSDWYVNDDQRLIYFVSRLTGRAEKLARAGQDTFTGKFRFATIEELKKALTISFGDPDSRKTAGIKLLRCEQGHRPFAEFIAEWEGYYYQSGWAGRAGIDTLMDALHPTLKTRFSYLADEVVATTVEGIIQQLRTQDRKARDADPSYHKKKSGKPSNLDTTPQIPSATPQIDVGDPMDLSVMGAKLPRGKKYIWTREDCDNRKTPKTEEEREAKKKYWKDNKLCSWCFSSAHGGSDCPNAPWATTVNPDGHEPSKRQGKA